MTRGVGVRHVEAREGARERAAAIVPGGGGAEVDDAQEAVRVVDVRVGAARADVVVERAREERRGERRDHAVERVGREVEATQKRVRDRRRRVAVVVVVVVVARDRAAQRVV